MACSRRPCAASIGSLRHREQAGEHQDREHRGRRPDLGDDDGEKASVPSISHGIGSLVMPSD